MVSQERARAGNRDLQFGYKCRGDDRAARCALDRAPSRLAVCISIHGSIQCDLDCLLADDLSPTRGGQAGVAVGTRAYSQRPAGTLGEDRMVSSSYLPPNLDIRIGEISYRSHLVVFSLLAAKIPVDRARCFAARNGTAADRDLQFGDGGQYFRGMACGAVDPSWLDGKSGAQDGHAWVCDRRASSHAGRSNPE